MSTDEYMLPAIIFLRVASACFTESRTWLILCAAQCPAGMPCVSRRANSKPHRIRVLFSIDISTDITRTLSQALVVLP